MELLISIESVPSQELEKILQAHWEFCNASTPAEHVYAVNPAKLFSPGITVFAGRVNGEIASVGALRVLEPDHAELKSMHTLAKYRGQGFGKLMVQHIETFAKAQNIGKLSLETGTSELFKPARTLYTSLGFMNSDAFGDYVLSEDNICMSKEIE